jgi:hypothetical protein
MHTAERKLQYNLSYPNVLYDDIGALSHEKVHGIAAATAAVGVGGMPASNCIVTLHADETQSCSAP